MKGLWLSVLVSLILFDMSSWAADAPIRIGSKNFNESYLLSEIAAQLLESRGFSVERQFGLGGTLICYQALRNREIDLYMEYTGTLSQAILKQTGNPSRPKINQLLVPFDLELLDPLGFNNTYAMVVPGALAESEHLQTIGDLAKRPDLNVVVSHEFLQRNDGWPGLQATYELPHAVAGIEHGLAYQAISEGSIDVTDAYSTDGELERYALTVLADDRGYFPSYYAAPLVHGDLPDAVRLVLAELTNTIDDAYMQRLNAQVVFEGKSFAEVARSFLSRLGVQSTIDPPSIWDELGKNTWRHLELTGLALALAVVIGLGLSIWVYRYPRLADAVIYVCGLIQTIPSIALLALMIPLFGIGFVPAIVALFLYSLLPILRNAVTALAHVEPTLVKVATAIGLTSSQRLRYVLLPLSLPAIFAGIRTAAVISIGTATLAAFIGAGGLGDPIVVGLALDNTDLILQGAVPAAGLAILTELLFAMIEKRLVQ